MDRPAAADSRELRAEPARGAVSEAGPGAGRGYRGVGPWGDGAGRRRDGLGKERVAADGWGSGESGLRMRAAAKRRGVESSWGRSALVIRLAVWIGEKYQSE